VGWAKRLFVLPTEIIDEWLILVCNDQPVAHPTLLQTLKQFASNAEVVCFKR